MMELLVQSVNAVGALVATVLRSFTDIFLTPPLKATLKHLQDIDLKTMKGGKLFYVIQFRPTSFSFILEHAAL